MFLKSMQEQRLPACASEILKDKFLETELQRQVTWALHTGRYVWPVDLHGVPAALREISALSKFITGICLLPQTVRRGCLWHSRA